MSSFHCPHCGTSNSSLQPGAAIEERGVKYTFKVQEHEVHVHVFVLVQCQGIKWASLSQEGFMEVHVVGRGPALHLHLVCMVFDTATHFQHFFYTASK